MDRISVIAVAVAALVAGAALHAGVAEAQEAGLGAVCIEVPQQPGKLNLQAAQRFMNTQLAAGRTTFVSVEGVSTGLCAY